MDDDLHELDFEEDDLENYVLCCSCDYELLPDEARTCSRCGNALCEFCVILGDDCTGDLCKPCRDKMRKGK